MESFVPGVQQFSLCPTPLWRMPKQRDVLGLLSPLQTHVEIEDTLTRLLFSSVTRGPVDNSVGFAFLLKEQHKNPRQWHLTEGAVFALRRIVLPTTTVSAGPIPVVKIRNNPH